MASTASGALTQANKSEIVHLTGSPLVNEARPAGENVQYKSLELGTRVYGFKKGPRLIWGDGHYSPNFSAPCTKLSTSNSLVVERNESYVEGSHVPRLLWLTSATPALQQAPGEKPFRIEPSGANVTLFSAAPRCHFKFHKG